MVTFVLIIMVIIVTAFPVPAAARSTAARLLRSCFRIPAGAWMLSIVCGVCC
jgi:hypothetical protein